MTPLQDLTLLNKFLFDETMDIPEAHEAALQIILQQDDLLLLTPSQTEKEIRTMPWLRSIRLDVFAVDQDHVIYNTEMQREKRNDLIMPFDLFGLGKYRYTFRSFCEEDKSLALQDGAVRIFLNTRGTNDHEVSRELIDFLHYVENTDDDTVSKTRSERIRQIHKCVQQIKSSEEMGVKYMQKWEEKIIDREKGRSEGLSEGLVQGRNEGKATSIIEILEELGAVPEVLRSQLLAQSDPAILSAWLKKATKVSNIQEFADLTDIKL